MPLDWDEDAAYEHSRMMRAMDDDRYAPDDDDHEDPRIAEAEYDDGPDDDESDRAADRYERWLLGDG
jgi:hypothetical protein